MVDVVARGQHGQRTGPAPDHAEAPRTLEEAAPRTLGLLDQTALWGNLGVSILGFTGAIVVIQPGGPGTPYVPFLVALAATVAGTVLGSLAVAATSAVGARAGVPTMVMLRGVFGARASAAPTVLNVVQMVGWGTFEVVTIATALTQVVPGVPRWVWVLVCGVLTTVLALRPLGSVRLLRRWVSLVVVLALAWLTAHLLTHPIDLGGDLAGAGGWSGFGVGVDTTLAVAVSWVPMAADYSRHSRSTRAAFVGPFAGYAVLQVACYGIGLLALVTVASGADEIFTAFLAVPLGVVAFLVVTVRELDQSFADVYATTLSTQNLRPRWDRRAIALVVGVVVTVLALTLRIDDYAAFLTLVGSVFVALCAVLVVDHLLAGARWDLSETSPTRWALLVPWVAGVAAYHLVPPGPLVSASLVSFLVAALGTLAVHGVGRAVGRTV